MYGVAQAGKIANNLLTKPLAPKGYYQCCHTVGLWKYKWRPVLFSLVVDNFSMKYVGKQHVNHLLDALEEHYKVTKAWDGKLYCSITLELANNNSAARRLPPASQHFDRRGSSN